jgi:hypothetical protein
MLLMLWSAKSIHCRDRCLKLSQSYYNSFVGKGERYTKYFTVCTCYKMFIPAPLDLLTTYISSIGLQSTGDNNN